MSTAYSTGYGYHHGEKHEPWVHYYMIYALIEIQKAAAFATAGVRPPRRQWTAIGCRTFLRILGDVTTWSLTHFEPVRAWSAAEDLTPIEQSEGRKLVGRVRRSTTGSYPNKELIRTLTDVSDPALRGSALWLAHALMARYHQDASDRPTGLTSQSRQQARLACAAPAGRAWLADRMLVWPEPYRAKRWIDLFRLTETTEIIDAKY